MGKGFISITLQDQGAKLSDSLEGIAFDTAGFIGRGPRSSFSSIELGLGLMLAS